MPILLAQDKNNDTEVKKNEQENNILNVEPLNIRNVRNINAETFRLKDINRFDNIQIKTKPNKALNKKGVAIVQNKDDYEEFEFEKTTPHKNNEDDLGKTIHVHCPPYSLNFGYSNMYLLKTENFEENIEVQTDWMFLLSFSLRGTIESDFDSHLTFFTGINAVLFQLDYGFSGGDYQALRIRRSFNFYLAQKSNFKKNNSLFGDYVFISDTHYHYETFFSSIYIEPIVEFRMGRNGHDSEFAIGISFGVSF